MRSSCVSKGRSGVGAGDDAENPGEGVDRAVKGEAEVELVVGTDTDVPIVVTGGVCVGTRSHGEHCDAEGAMAVAGTALRAGPYMKVFCFASGLEVGRTTRGPYKVRIWMKSMEA